MASGKSLLTYTGKQPSIELQGMTFTKDVPQLIRDNGIIGAAQERDDFTVGPVVEDSAPDPEPSASPATEEAPKAPKKAAEVRAEKNTPPRQAARSAKTRAAREK